MVYGRSVCLSSPSSPSLPWQSFSLSLLQNSAETIELIALIKEQLDGGN